MDKKVNINIVHYRYRKCDPGGISHKAAIDGLVNEQILSDDSAKEIEEIRERQKKVPASEPEVTVIIISDIDSHEKMECLLFFCPYPFDEANCQSCRYGKRRDQKKDKGHDIPEHARGICEN